MSRKDFELIADVLFQAKLDADTLQALAAAFAARLSNTNAAFNRTRFLKACGAKE